MVKYHYYYWNYFIVHYTETFQPNPFSFRHNVVIEVQYDFNGNLHNESRLGVIGPYQISRRPLSRNPYLRHVPYFEPNSGNYACLHSHTIYLN